MGKFEGLVHRLTANAAYRLRCKYLLFVGFKDRTMFTVLVGSLGGTFFVAWHGSCHLRVGMKKRPKYSRDALSRIVKNDK